MTEKSIQSVNLMLLAGRCFEEMGVYKQALTFVSDGDGVKAYLVLTFDKNHPIPPKLSKSTIKYRLELYAEEEE